MTPRMRLLLQRCKPINSVKRTYCTVLALMAIPSSLLSFQITSPTFSHRTRITNTGRLFTAASSGTTSDGSDGKKSGATTSTTTKKTMAERVLETPQWPEKWPFSPIDFMRQDEADDAVFYQSPRLVYHIDDSAVTALTEYYSKEFKDGTKDVLDICSSWVSHYPEDWSNRGGNKNVVGLGMNAYELSQNPQLTSFVVQDLNKNPTLPFEDDSFDVVTCVVSVDYLNQPLEVMRDVGRVLRPGGVCYCTLSNRCFPTKAFRIWLQTNDLEHIFIVGSFFHYSNMFEPPSCKDVSPNPGQTDPLYIVKAQKKL